MRDQTRPLVQQLWSYCNVLRDDGLSYPDYVEQLTYLLFLKMADEVRNSNDSEMAQIVPSGYDWSSLVAKTGTELAYQYELILGRLGQSAGMLETIFSGARNKIRDPRKLELLVVGLIGQRDWSSLDVDVKGSAYEGLLEKNAQDTKSGAGQYFTPRPVVDAIVRCVRPAVGEVIYDPACGTAGFLISAYKFMCDHDGKLSDDELQHLRLESVRGAELVPEVTRLAAMNLLLHGIGPVGNEAEVPVKTLDSLAARPDRTYDVVLTNPPFGTRSSIWVWTEDGQRRGNGIGVMRPDLWVSTSNKELNFLQHVANILGAAGRAAIVVPDGVLTGSGAGAYIRRRLLTEFDVHTLLRLPTGLFYAQGINANVLFFDRPATQVESGEKALWVYDLRTHKRFSLTGNRFSPADIEEFVEVYCPDDRSARCATWTEESRDSRWRPYDVERLLQDPEVTLDLAWIRSPDTARGYDNSESLIASIVADLETALSRARELRI
jgi:type I restriction enzyme M protein